MGRLRSALTAATSAGGTSKGPSKSLPARAFWLLSGTKRKKRSCQQGALPGCRPTMKSPSAASLSCSKPRACRPNQQVEFLSDGGEDVRNVQLYLNPQAE